MFDFWKKVPSIFINLNPKKCVLTMSLISWKWITEWLRNNTIHILHLWSNNQQQVEVMKKSYSYHHDTWGLRILQQFMNFPLIEEHREVLFVQGGSRSRVRCTLPRNPSGHLLKLCFKIKTWKSFLLVGFFQPLNLHVEVRKFSLCWQTKFHVKF